MLLQKGKVPDGSFFDTPWRIFLHHVAHFYEPDGALANLVRVSYPAGSKICALRRDMLIFPKSVIYFQ